MSLEFDNNSENFAKIRVFGVGGAGKQCCQQNDRIWREGRGADCGKHR